MNPELITSLQNITAFLALLFSFYLFSSQSSFKNSNVFIALFLLLFAINLLNNYIEALLDPYSPNISVFLNMTAYLMAPAFYLYIRSSLSANFKISKKDIIHILPFILLNILIIPSIYMENLKEDPQDLDIHNTINIVLFFFFYIQLAFYIAMSYKLLNQRKKLYEENYSNPDLRKYKYLFHFISILTVMFILSAIKNYTLYNYEGPFLDIAISLVLLSTLVLCCWIIIKGLKSPELFQVEEAKLPDSVNHIVKAEKALTKKSKNDIEIDSEKNNILINELESFMSEKEPYLDPSLTLDSLSEQLDMHSRDLSILINHRLGKHFFDFINEYRIKKAQDILKMKEDEKKTVLEILYEVGFNSKSSFNTEFKKKTGLTPSQYKKQIA